MASIKVKTEVKKWKHIQNKDIGGRPFYYSEIYVDPLNENRLYNVHTYLSKVMMEAKVLQHCRLWQRGASRSPCLLDPPSTTFLSN